RRFLKNITTATVRSYRCMASATFKYLPEAQLLTPEILNECVIRMREAGLSPVSVNTHLRSLNAFLRWLHEKKHTQVLLIVEKLGVEQKVLPVFSVEQITQLVSFKPAMANEHRI